MDAIPERPPVARLHRALYAIGERYIPIPNINPSWWSLAGLVACVACLFTPSAAVKFWLVFFAFVTDWYDGATARRHGTVSREGYLVDDVIDRFSEAFIFLADVFTSGIARIFFLLWIFNCVLTVRSVATGKHRILPLRFVYLFVLAYWALA